MSTVTTRELTTLMKREVSELRKRYYASAGDAFCHFAVRVLFDLDEDDAFQVCDTGGRDDKGIDGFWYDEDQGRAVVVQAKYRTTKTTFDRRPVLELESAYGWLEQEQAARTTTARRQVREAATQLADLRADDPEFPVELYCVVSGTFTKAAVEQAEAFNRAHEKDNVLLHLVDVAVLADHEEDRRSRAAEPLKKEIPIHLAKFFEVESEDGSPPTVVASVNGKELAEIEREHRFRIFQQNVRYFMGNRKVNNQIAETIGTPDGRKHFWYYNNGISIVCDSYRLDRKKGIAHITNLQIVNGCQTTTTLGENVDELEDENSPVHVLVRIIASDDEDLQRKITIYNNRQTAVRDRDLLSNDSVQERLQLEFDALKPPWYYERKRGGWQAEVQKDARLRARYSRRKVENEKAAQAAYAFYFDPAQARARKRFLFVQKSENPPGYYEDLFNHETTPRWLLLPYLVNQYVGEKKREYLRNIKDIERETATVQELRLLQRDWLKFADQMMVGAIGFYFRQRLDLKEKNLKAILAEDVIDAAIERAYALALRDLNPFFRSKVKDAERQERTFVPANFVKGNWPEVRARLESEWEFREDQGDDPFAGIDLLEAD